MSKSPGSRALRQKKARSEPQESLRLRQIPLTAAALAFSAGILHAHFVTQPTVVLVCALTLLFVLSVAALCIAQNIAWIPVLATWTVLGSAAAAWQPSPPQPTALLRLADNLSRNVNATVVRVRVLPPIEPDPADADPVPPWEQVETLQPGVPVTSVDLALEDVEQLTPDISRMEHVTGGVRLTVYQPRIPKADVAYQTESVVIPALHCGDRVEMALRMRPPDTYRNPGQFQYADFLLQQGIAARANIGADQIRVVSAGSPTLSCRLTAAQQWAAERLTLFAASPQNQHLPPALRLTAADTRMLAAMLFGDRTGLTHPLRTAFERTGSFHLFVVSGLHIALLAGAVFWISRKLRIPPWLATLLTLAVTAAYAALTGFGASAQRALLMTAVYLIARLLFRRGHSLNALGAAALAMLIWSPASLFEPGLQMTLLALVAIAGLALPLGRYLFLDAARVASAVFIRPRRDRSIADAALRLRLELWGDALSAVLGVWPLPLPGRRGHMLLTARKLPAYLVRAICWTAELALIGLVTELVMVLPMAVWFNRAAVFALPANMLVIPVLALLIPSAVFTFVASLFGPWAASLPGALTAGLLHLLTWVIGRVSHLRSADVRIPAPVWGIGLLAVCAWIVCCWLVRRGRWGALTTACALPLIATAILWPEPPITAFAPSDPLAKRPLELTAIDIGQGDSLLAVNPDGRTMLIDAGGPIGRSGQAEVTASFDTGEQVVAPYLWSRRIRRLDVVVLSHAHTDHMGGLPAILEDLRPRELWVSIDPDSALYRHLLDQAARLGITIRHLHARDHVAWGPVAVSVLGPAPAYANPGAPRNDDSLVLHMQYGAASILLEGDAERPSEDAMLAGGLITPVTLLKVGHHGSKTSSNPEFLAAARPQVAVLSAGRHNSFGHPKPEVVLRFAQAQTRLYRTDLFGLSSFFLTPDGQIKEQAGASPDAPGKASLLHSGLF